MGDQVCDIDGERCARVAAEHGATGYADYRAMLAHETLDVVFVCLPPGAQAEQVAAAARAGAAVFVTKPVALDLDTARRTLDALAQSEVINQVGYMARYADITARASELIGSRPLAMGLGRFMTRIQPGHPWWGKKAISGGQIVEQSTHVFDLLRYFLGEVTEVQCYGHAGLAPEVADFEDCTICTLRFRSGAIGTVASTYAARVEQGSGVELVGRDLYLKLVMDTNMSGTTDGQEVDYHGEEAGYLRQVQQFLQAVEQHDQSLVRSSYADAVRTLAVTLTADRALTTGRPELVAEP
jgi:predicted dehydrogenase